MNIDPRHLRILLAVVRQGSFSAAAQMLNMTQPSISIAISQLEDRLKCKVVNRDRKGATLTREGQILLRHAIAMEEILTGAVAEIDAISNGIEGPISIGGTTGAFLAMVPPVLAQLQADAGALDVSLIDMGDEALTEALQSRRISFALCSARQGALPPDLEEINLLREPFLLVSGPDRLPAGGLTVAEAARRPWVFPRVTGETKRRIEAVFISAGVPMPSHIIRCDVLSTQKEILRQGNAVALLPRSAVATELQHGILGSAPLLGGPLPRRLVALKLRGVRLPPLAERFLDLACGAFSDEL